MSTYTKAIVSFFMSAAIIVIQAVTGAYGSASHIGILGWLGIAATLLGPAGLVYAWQNTPFSPASKAIAQAVAAAALVFVQGVYHVYSVAGSISTLAWLGILGTLLTTVVVYFVPNSSAQGRHLG